MNVYDFDGTIFSSNCVVGFAIYCMNRQPKLWFTFFPRVVAKFVLQKLGKIPYHKFLKELFSYLTKVKNFDDKIEKYWDKNEKKISLWYLKQKQSTDLIISASPTCIIKPIANRLNVKFIASEFDREFGVFTNNLMYAKEKAKYMIDHDFPVIKNFYSDSLSDTPLALCAEKAHLVTKRATTINDWPSIDTVRKKVKNKIDTGWNIHLKDEN